MREPIEGAEAAAELQTPTALQLNDLARAMRDVAATAHRVGISARIEHIERAPDSFGELALAADLEAALNAPLAAAHQPPDVAHLEVPVEASSAVATPGVADEPEHELPQILQQPYSFSDGPSPTEVREHLTARLQFLAPAVLVAALLGVSLLMFVSASEMARVPGLAWLTDKPRPTLVAGTPLRLGLDASPPLSSDAVPEPEPEQERPPLSLEDLILLERCEEMIARGDILLARQELARAANDGSVNARFALAETFDPNVLASWGLRDRVADVGVANALYGQALAAGDARARRRIQSLRDSP